MEVACGEYGDMVPGLVVAVKSNRCELYQQSRKLDNFEKGLMVAMGPNDEFRKQFDAELTVVKETDMKEVLADEKEAMMTPMHNNYLPSVAMGDGGTPSMDKVRSKDECGLALLKEVGFIFDCECLNASLLYSSLEKLYNMVTLCFFHLFCCIVIFRIFRCLFNF